MFLSITFLLTALLIAIGATVSTLAGFGFAISITPFMLMLYPPKVAVPLLLAISAMGNLVQWLRSRRAVDYRCAGWLILGALVGLPLGGAVLNLVPAPTLKAMIGGVVLLAVLASVARRQQGDLPPRRPPTLLTVATGLAGGILATATAQSGLAMSLLMAWTRMDKSMARATLFAVFMVVNTAGVLTLQAEHTLATSTLWLALSLMPFFFAGVLLGDVGFRRTTQQGYRRLMLGLLSLSAFVGVWGGIKALIK